MPANKNRSCHLGLELMLNSVSAVQVIHINYPWKALLEKTIHL